MNGLEQYVNKKNTNRNNQPDPRTEDEGFDLRVYDYDEGMILSEDVPAIIAAINMKDEDTFKSCLDMYDEVVDAGKLSQFTRSTRTPTAIRELWARISYFKSRYSVDEMRSHLRDIKIQEDNSELDSVRSLLHETGVSALFISRKGEIVTLNMDIQGIIKNVIRDPTLLKEELRLNRKFRVGSLIQRLFILFATATQSRQDDGGAGQMRYMQGLTSWFFLGAVAPEFSDFNVEQFKVNKEVGHYDLSGMEPKPYIQEVAAFYAATELSAVAVFAGEENFSPSLPTEYSDGVSIVVSDCDDSPYFWDHTPTLHIDPDPDTKDWSWINIMRAAQETTNAQEILDPSGNGATQRKRAIRLKETLLENAISYRKRDRGMDFSDDCGILSEYYTTKWNQSYYMKFHKRSVSKMDEIVQYPSRIHFIPQTLVAEVLSDSDTLWIPYVIGPSSLVCMIVPHAYFQCSKYFKENGYQPQYNEYFASYPFGIDAKGFSVFVGLVVADYHSPGDDDLRNLEYYKENLASRLAQGDRQFRKVFPEDMDDDYIKEFANGLLSILFRHEGKFAIVARSSKTGYKKMVKMRKKYGARKTLLSLAPVSSVDDPGDTIFARLQKDKARYDAQIKARQERSLLSTSNSAPVDESQVQGTDSETSGEQVSDPGVT